MSQPRSVLLKCVFKTKTLPLVQPKFSVAEAEDQTLTTFRPSVISYDNRKVLNRLSNKYVLPCYALSDIGCDRVAKLFVRQLP